MDSKTGCGQCIHFTPKTKNAGSCGFHALQLRNLTTGRVEYAKYRVMKYHYCLEFKPKI